MRRRPAQFALPALALVLAACSGASPSDDLGPLADQADRVADLIAQDRTCQAAEAVRTLESMVDDDISPTVADAVTSFTSSADELSATCETETDGTSTDSPSPTPPPPPPPPPPESDPDPEPGDGDGKDEPGHPGNGNPGNGNPDNPGGGPGDNPGRGQGGGRGG